MQKEYDKIQNRRDFLNGITDSFTNFFTTIMSGSKDAASAFKDMANSILQSFEKLIAEMLAKKIAAFIMNLIFPGAGTATSAASTLFSNMAGAGRLAKGGVVPSGFPNDSYPAMLTSGERIIPAGGNGSMLLQLEPVSLTLKGNNLEGWIRKNDTRKRSI
jgi:hypothetical protein